MFKYESMSLDDVFMWASFFVLFIAIIVFVRSRFTSRENMAMPRKNEAVCRLHDKCTKGDRGHEEFEEEMHELDT
jgi:uncharacterized membrane protein